MIKETHSLSFLLLTKLGFHFTLFNFFYVEQLFFFLHFLLLFLCVPYFARHLAYTIQRTLIKIISPLFHPVVNTPKIHVYISGKEFS